MATDQTTSEFIWGACEKTRLLGHAGPNTSQNSGAGAKGLLAFQELQMSIHSIVWHHCPYTQLAALTPSQPPEKKSSEVWQYSDNKGLVEPWLYYLLAIRLCSVLRFTWDNGYGTQNVGLKWAWNTWLLLLVLLLFINMSQLIIHPHSLPSSNWLALRIPF